MLLELVYLLINLYKKGGIMSGSNLNIGSDSSFNQSDIKIGEYLPDNRVRQRSGGMAGPTPLVEKTTEAASKPFADKSSVIPDDKSMGSHQASKSVASSATSPPTVNKANKVSIPLLGKSTVKTQDLGKFMESQHHLQVSYPPKPLVTQDKKEAVAVSNAQDLQKIERNKKHSEFCSTFVSFPSFMSTEKSTTSFWEKHNPFGTKVSDPIDLDSYMDKMRKEYESTLSATDKSESPDATAALKRLESRKAEIIPLLGMVSRIIRDRISKEDYFEVPGQAKVPRQFQKDLGRSLTSLNKTDYPGNKENTNSTECVVAFRKNIKNIDERTLRRLEHVATQDLPNAAFGLINANLLGLTVKMIQPSPQVNIDTSGSKPEIRATTTFAVYDINNDPESFPGKPLKIITAQVQITNLDNDNPYITDARVIIQKPINPPEDFVYKEIKKN